MKDIHFIVIAGSVSTCLSSNTMWYYMGEGKIMGISLSLSILLTSIFPSTSCLLPVYFGSTSVLLPASSLLSSCGLLPAGPGTVHVRRGTAGGGGSQGAGPPGPDAAEEGCHGDQQDSQRAAGEGATVSQQPPFLPGLAPLTSFRPVTKAAKSGKV